MTAAYTHCSRPASREDAIASRRLYSGAFREHAIVVPLWLYSLGADLNLVRNPTLAKNPMTTPADIFSLELIFARQNRASIIASLDGSTAPADLRIRPQQVNSLAARPARVYAFNRTMRNLSLNDHAPPPSLEDL
ncbi:hypothetical protein PspLS_03665 [Pyricularia sp. CBS 133598]|nr:hypothetical protein PspLS_03665 [Pyricularia sp. CBS 133598]